MLLNPQLPGTIAYPESPYPAFAQLLPDFNLREGRYSVHFAHTIDELDEILRLRFEVFNLELAEGLSRSYLTGRDEDGFDRNCHHLGVRDAESGRIVGTYRVQTGDMAAAGPGFYSAGEFNLASLPAELLDCSIELGRACIAADHRNTQVLYLLWKGLAAYLQHNNKRYLFGCCSLTGRNPHEGRALYEYLRREGFIHPEFNVNPLPECICNADGGEPEYDAPAIPKLFRTYLKFGARVCSAPAIDREFGTIDFLVLFDIAEISPFSRRMFFGS